MQRQNNKTQGKNLGFFGRTFRDFTMTLDDFKGFNDIYEPSFQKNNLRRILVFGIPVLFSSFIILFRLFLSINADNGLLIAFSIFTTLLFNFLLLMHNFSYSGQRSSEVDEKLEKQKFVIYKASLKHSLSELRFGILISVFDLIFLIAYQWLFPITFLHLYLSFIIYYLTILFLIVLFRILKDVFIFSSYHQNK